MSEEKKPEDKIQIVEVAVGELKDSEYNPRTATEDDYANLKKSIERFDLVEPLVVNSAENRKNIVIGGHFRLKVSKDLGKLTVPVVYRNIPDINKEKELNLRLNNNTGENDRELLAQFDVEMLEDVGMKDELLKLDNEIPLLEDVIFDDAYEPNWVVVRFDDTLRGKILEAVAGLKNMKGVRVDVGKED